MAIFLTAFPGDAYQKLDKYLSVLRDTTGSLTYEEVKEMPFLPLKKHFNFGFTEDTIWAKLSIPRELVSDEKWLLRIGIPYLDSLQTYQTVNGETVSFDKSRGKSLWSEPYPNRDAVVPVYITGEIIDIYMRIYSRDGTTVNAQLMTEKEFLKHDLVGQFFFGGYFGVMLAMAVYNFFLFLSLRDRRYIFYVVFTLSVALNAAAHYEFLHQFFLKGSDWLNIRLNMITFSLAILASIQFVRSFLSTAQEMKVLDKIFKLFIAIFISILIYSLVSPYPGSLVLFINLLPLLVLIAVAGVRALRQRRDPASSYFLVAFGVFITGVGLFTLRRFGLLAPSPYVNYTFMIGSVFETMLLSFALANQINTLREQKEKAQGELIAQIRQYNKSLEKMKGDLEETVEVRTSHLQKSLKEKDLLLKEVHHRVKNNLSVITSLLGFQIIRESADGEAGEALRAGCRRIESMALVHELLCTGDNLSEVDVNEYFGKLLSNIKDTYQSYDRGIDLSFEVENIPLHMDVLVACGLIVSELVTNSLKHAFEGRDGGKIHVALYADEGGIRLSVIDDGIGLEGDNVENLGMKLVRLMAEQLDGTIKYEKKQGSVWRIQFPLGAE